MIISSSTPDANIQDIVISLSLSLLQSRFIVLSCTPGKAQELISTKTSATETFFFTVTVCVCVICDLLLMAVDSEAQPAADHTLLLMTATVIIMNKLQRLV